MQTVKQDNSKTKAYGLSLQQRERLTLTGVKDVLAFDENQVILLTEGGELAVAGQSLHVDKLSLEAGELALTGTIDSLMYERPRRIKNGSLAARIFK